jgi:hypothetical protein
MNKRIFNRILKEVISDELTWVDPVPHGLDDTRVKNHIKSVYNLISRSTENQVAAIKKEIAHILELDKKGEVKIGDYVREKYNELLTSGNAKTETATIETSKIAGFLAEIVIDELTFGLDSKIEDPTYDGMIDYLQEKWGNGPKYYANMNCAIYCFAKVKQTEKTPNLKSAIKATGYTQTDHPMANDSTTKKMYLDLTSKFGGDDTKPNNIKESSTDGVSIKVTNTQTKKSNIFDLTPDHPDFKTATQTLKTGDVKKIADWLVDMWNTKSAANQKTSNWHYEVAPTKKRVDQV